MLRMYRACVNAIPLLQRPGGPLCGGTRPLAARPSRRQRPSSREHQTDKTYSRPNLRRTVSFLLPMVDAKPTGSLLATLPTLTLAASAGNLSELIESPRFVEASRKPAHTHCFFSPSHNVLFLTCLMFSSHACSLPNCCDTDRYGVADATSLLPPPAATMATRSISIARKRRKQHYNNNTMVTTTTTSTTTAVCSVLSTAATTRKTVPYRVCLQEAHKYQLLRACAHTRAHAHTHAHAQRRQTHTQATCSPLGPHCTHMLTRSIFFAHPHLVLSLSFCYSVSLLRYSRTLSRSLFSLSLSISLSLSSLYPFLFI